jgi:hypothetical protein
MFTPPETEAVYKIQPYITQVPGEIGECNKQKILLNVLWGVGVSLQIKE